MIKTYFCNQSIKQKGERFHYELSGNFTNMEH